LLCYDGYDDEVRVCLLNLICNDDLHKKTLKTMNCKKIMSENGITLDVAAVTDVVDAVVVAAVTAVTDVVDAAVVAVVVAAVTDIAVVVDAVTDFSDAVVVVAAAAVSDVADAVVFVVIVVGCCCCYRCY